MNDTIEVDLACGHLREIPDTSPHFDMPDEPLWCNECQTLRQMSIELQLAIYELRE